MKSQIGTEWYMKKERLVAYNSLRWINSPSSGGNGPTIKLFPINLQFINHIKKKGQVGVTEPLALSMRTDVRTMKSLASVDKKKQSANWKMKLQQDN